MNMLKHRQSRRPSLLAAAVSTRPLSLPPSTSQLTSWVLLPLAILSFSLTFLRAYRATLERPGDLFPVWMAVRAFIHHQPSYLPPDEAFRLYHQVFLYPPSSLIILAPFGLVDFPTAKLPFLVLATAAILVGGWLCLRLFGLHWASPAGILLLLGLSLWIAVRQTLWLENFDGFILAGEAGALLAATRQRWLLAGCLLGLTYAIKPGVLPLLLIPLIYRRWASAALAAAIPAVLSAVALLLSVDAIGFFTGSVPFLLQGQGPTADIQIYNVSIQGAVANLGLPALLGVVLRVAVLAGTAFLVWRRWKLGGDEALRLTELSGLIVLATLLTFSYSFERYALWLLPLLVSVAHPTAAMRSWIAWLGVYGMGSPDGNLVWSHLGLGARWQVRVTGGLLLILVTLAIRTVRLSRHVPEAAPATAKSSSAPGVRAPEFPRRTPLRLD